MGGADFRARSGFHTFQVISGCVVGSDGRFLRGFGHTAYDGTETFTLKLELSPTTEANKTTQITVQRDLFHQDDVEGWSAYVENTCVHRLRLFLEKRKETLLRTGTRVRASPRRGSVGWGGFLPGEEENGAASDPPPAYEREDSSRVPYSVTPPWAQPSLKDNKGTQPLPETPHSSSLTPCSTWCTGRSPWFSG